jgi:exopolyphosphatase/guanosine-5'-triphosphate,3'-diphosphate pyrophosphatase
MTATPVAIIEIGTNSAKLLIATCRGATRFRTEHFTRKTTRIGAGMTASDGIATSAVERTLAAINEFRRTARRYRCERIVAFSTFALRRASNSRAVLRRIEQALGGPLHILTGRDEAMFSYRSAAAALDLNKPNTVLFDTGGGSTELVLATAGRVARVRSLPIGALHLTERFLTSDPPRREELRSLEKFVDERVERASRAMGIDRLEPGAVALVACGGSVSTAAKMIARRSSEAVRAVTIRRGDVASLLRRVAALNNAERRRIAGLEPDRADIIVGGLAIVLSILRHTRKRTCLFNPGGVREGVLGWLMQRDFRW